MNEVRIDVTKQSAEELALATRQKQLIFLYINTMPGTPEYDALAHELFQNLGENSRVGTLGLGKDRKFS